MTRFLAGASAASRRGAVGIALLVALGLAGCGAEDSSSEPDPDSAGGTSSTALGEAESFTYVALGDSWPEGAHCNGCRTFPKIHAEGLSDVLGERVWLYNLAGSAQPYFDTPTGGGSAGLLKALRTDEGFRDEVGSGDVIMISTGPNDIDIGEIENGPCGGKNDTACVAELDRGWHRDFDAILEEIEGLRAGRPTAIRLVNAINAFNDPSFSPATRRGWEAVFEALTEAMCDNAEKHDVVCVDVRPVLNGPDFEQPVNDSSQEAMDAVAELLVQTGIPELEE
jgi:hypothetical protein